MYASNYWYLFALGNGDACELMFNVHQYLLLWVLRIMNEERGWGRYNVQYTDTFIVDRLIEYGYLNKKTQWSQGYVLGCIYALVNTTT